MKVEIKDQTRSVKIIKSHLKTATQLILDKCKKDINISILLCGKEFIRMLNREFRKKDKPTDVLSFVYGDTPQDIAAESFYGEIVLCPMVAKKQAKRYNNDLNTEMKRLLVHGVLHLIGYDHEISEKEETIMFKKQEELLKILEEINLC